MLNDVGPYIPAVALCRPRAYVGSADRRFASLDAGQRRLREVHAPFGALNEDEWRHLTLNSLKPHADGGFELHYDPGISQAYRRWQYMSVDLWSTWRAIQCPVLVLGGVDSDFLTRDTVARMQRSGPRVSSIEFPGCGHVPSLMRADQLDAVTAFLVADA